MKIDLLSTSEVAEKAGITIGRVRQLIHAGILPAQKLGKFNYVSAADLSKLEGRKHGRPKKEKIAK